MCPKHCSEVHLDRKDFCEDCARETADDFESRLQDIPTLDLEAMTAAELAEIERKLREEKKNS